MRTTTRRLALALILAGTIAACGSDDGATDPDGPSEDGIEAADAPDEDAADDAAADGGADDDLEAAPIDDTEVAGDDETDEAQTVDPDPDADATDAADAGQDVPAVAASTASMPVAVDVGGAPPSDPAEIEIQDELDAFLTANDVPTGQAELFGYFAADRWIHLIVENATIRTLTTQWGVDEDGTGRLVVNTTYRLDRAGLDEAAVADAIEAAMAATGLERTVRQDIEEGVSDSVKLQFGSNGEDNFKVRVPGADDDDPEPNTLRILTTASFTDTLPQVIAPVAPLLPTLDEIEPDGPIVRIETGVENNPFPRVARELERLTTVSPDDFATYPSELGPAAAAIFGDDPIQEKIEDDLIRYQYRDGRVQASIEDQGVVVLLIRSLIPE